MAIEIFNRQEIKLVITHDQLKLLLPTIRQYMRLDKHNLDGRAYRLYNLYIDTNDFALVRHSVNKPTVYKEKMRIRSYEPLTPSSKVFLELKKRYKKVTNKRRTQIVLKDALNFIKSGELPTIYDYMNLQVVSEFAVSFTNHHYRPTVYINYDRMAFHSLDNASDLRITFDTNLFSQAYDNDKQYRLLDENMLIMEIKSITNMPLWLVKLLDEHDIRKQSFSKYGTEYARFLKEKVGAQYA